MNRSSRIRDIYIPINYNFFHSPNGRKKSDDEYIPRDEIEKRLLSMMTKGQTHSGAYLITGYRGMGKTSLVRKVIKDYEAQLKEPKIKGLHELGRLLWPVKAKKRNTQLFDIEISLSQDDLKDFDVLRHICSKMEEKYAKWVKRLKVQRTLWVIALCTLAFTIPVLWGLLNGESLFGWQTDGFTRDWKNWEIVPEKSFFLSLEAKISILALGVAMLYAGVRSRFGEALLWGRENHYSVLRKLRQINDRIFSEVSSSRGSDLNPGKAGITLFNLGRKKTVTRMMASPKEIENELIEILRIFGARDEKEKPEFSEWLWPQFIFVFDELDKIHPNFELDGAVSAEFGPHAKGIGIGTSPDGSIRNRQKAVFSILANMKHFLNVAEAKFFFIAGREMYDASLADISDRDSFLGSIFHEVVYLPSFLKGDGKDRNDGISSLTLQYVSKIILENVPKGLDSSSKKWAFIYDLLKKKIEGNTVDNKVDDLKKEAINEQAANFVFVLQNFVSYLTYRSNGTPRKLRHLFEQFVVTKESIPKQDFQNGCLPFLGLPKELNENSSNSKKKSFFQKLDYWRKKKDNNNTHETTEGQIPKCDELDYLFLRFTVVDQYRLAFTAYLFRPFLISRSRFVKAFGDKLLFSTGFLLDHLFKFHGGAFSWHSLELTPEVIAVNRSPVQRQFIQELLNMLMKSHIREIESGLFQFKFFNKIRNEIAFVSKVSEQESAAFNFTLDESLGYKQFYHQRLEEAIRTAREYPGANEHPGRHLFGVAYLNSIIGDLHFFDQEFDEALLHYTESIHYLQGDGSIEKLDFQKFIALIEGRLKLGLTLEKMKSLNAALALVEQTQHEVLKYFDYVKTHSQTSPGTNLNNLLKSFHENIALIQQPFLARLALIEKTSVTGLGGDEIDECDIARTKLLNGLYGENESEDYLAMANYHLDVGNILFFKNGTLMLEPTKFDTEQWLTIKKFLSDRFSQNRGSEIGFPSSALFEYMMALARVIQRMKLLYLTPRKRYDMVIAKMFDPIQLLITLTHFISSPNISPVHVNKSGRLFVTTGTILSKIGDCLISGVGKLELTPEHLSGFLQLLNKINLPADLKKRNKNWQDTEIPSLQTTLSDLENYLGEYDSKPKAPNPLDIFKRFQNTNTDRINRPQPSEIICSALLFYQVAGFYFLKAGRMASFEFHKRKILYLIKEVLGHIQPLSEKIDSETTNNFYQAINKITKEGIKGMTWSWEMTNRPQIFKNKSLFDVAVSENTNDQQSRLIYNNLSHQPEIREITTLSQEIKFLWNSITQTTRTPQDHLSKFSPYGSQFVRIMELNYQVMVNYWKLKKLVPDFFSCLDFIDAFNREYSIISKNFPAWKPRSRQALAKYNSYYIKNGILKKCDAGLRWQSLEELGMESEIKKEVQNMYENLFPKSRRDEIGPLIADSLYCLTEMINALQVFGINYATNHTYRSVTHKKMGDWCRIFQSYYRMLYYTYGPQSNELKEFTEKITAEIGTNTLDYLDAKYHYELSVNNYYAAKEMHSGGIAYQNALNSMYYLEDDFSDNFYHFCAALERFGLSTEKHKNSIDRMKKFIENSKTFDVSSYVEDFAEA